MILSNWMKRRVATPELNTPVPVQAQSSIDLELVATAELPEFPSHEYMQLAERAGYAGAKRLSEVTAFRRWLSENGICVYDTVKVAEYLYRIKPADSAVRWNPLVEYSGWAMNRDGHMWNITLDGKKAFPDRLYAKPIPDVVLLTIAKIRERWGLDANLFFVSDFETPKDDPFLGVWFRGTFYIIERWDEPGFRM